MTAPGRHRSMSFRLRPRTLSGANPGQTSLFNVRDYVYHRWPCPHCGGVPLASSEFDNDPDHAADPCLGWLANVAHACCGHGSQAGAYVVTSSGCQPGQPVLELVDPISLRGADALAYFRDVGVGPADTQGQVESRNGRGRSAP
jgi:hypothetical protein